MKIGILTFHWATNYGAVLQAYALQEYLLSQGYSVEIINYKPPKYDIGFFSFLKSPRLLLSAVSFLGQIVKENHLHQFRSDHLRMTERYCSNDDLCRIEGFDVIIVGSDQVWNPAYTLHGEDGATSTYFLSFCKDPVKKIGYAVSFGCSEYPDEASSFAKEYIELFKRVGVRESTGQSILNKMGVTVPVTIVPDPTILYSKAISGLVESPIIRNDHVCIYLLHDQQIPLEQFRNIRIKPTTRSGSIHRWLSDIWGAKGLITNSYHGTIMAIISHTPFVAVTKSYMETQMADRLVSLLSVLGLEQRLTSSDDLVGLFNKPIDWADVDLRLLKYRAVGESFLSEALNENSLV